MEQKKTNLKTYLFVLTLVFLFSFTLVAIDKQQRILALISTALGVLVIIYDLYNALNIKDKK
ncbi:hypothetical protein N9R87_04645 [Flavobacteriaceae bacterium]|nr:hypothetical protein [Flavobacteriaceae bacterium]